MIEYSLYNKEKRFKYSKYKAIDIDRFEPNILNRKFNCNAPNQEWVRNITYLKYDNGRKRMYLSANDFKNHFKTAPMWN